jgi:outer membrane lipoprotein SlyB
MKNTINHKTLVALALCPSLLAACATQQGNDQLMGAGAGAVGGAALGCLTGFIAGGDASGCGKGAAIGAATGAVVGWGAVKLSQYQASQVRTPTDDQQMYGLTKPVDATQVKIRKGSSAPRTVKPGEAVNVTTDYSLMLPPKTASTPVTETWTLEKDGKKLAELPQKNTDRASGGWNADATIPVPTNAELGTYVIQHKVQAGASYDTDESTFIVAK